MPAALSRQTAAATVRGRAHPFAGRIREQATPRFLVPRMRGHGLRVTPPAVLPHATGTHP